MFDFRIFEHFTRKTLVEILEIYLIELNFNPKLRYKNGGLPY